jgi:hypothetical protein
MALRILSSGWSTSGGSCALIHSCRHLHKKHAQRSLEEELVQTVSEEACADNHRRSMLQQAMAL